jgi:hypothetical protein
MEGKLNRVGVLVIALSYELSCLILEINIHTQKHIPVFSRYTEYNLPQFKY